MRVFAAAQEQREKAEKEAADRKLALEVEKRDAEERRLKAIERVSKNVLRPFLKHRATGISYASCCANHVWL